MSQQAIVITDRKPGHENQALALCALLDWQPQLVPISATRLQKALFYVWDRVGKQPESAIPGDLPAQASAVVAAGSTTFFPAACVAARLQVPLIVILYPRGFRLEQAACILVPEFDRPAGPRRTSSRFRRIFALATSPGCGTVRLSFGTGTPRLSQPLG